MKSLKMPGTSTKKKTPKRAAPQKQRFQYRDPKTGRTRVRYMHASERHKARSDYAAPYLTLDRIEYQSAVTGEWITSRTQHREHLHAHDLEEVGNENMAALQAKAQQEKQAAFEAQIGTDIKEVYERLESGQSPEQIEATDMEYNGSGGYERSDI